VGSSGQKRRKKTQHETHLPKVGTTPAEHQHLEREAIADTIGFGGASSTTKTLIFVVVGVIFLVGILGLIILTTIY
jgi:hypothetical protein